MTRLCVRCGKRMDDVLPWPEHPSCVPEIAADFRASDKRARDAQRRAQAAKGRALAAVADAHPDAMATALAVIRDFAARMPEFSANDCRAAMDEAGVPTKGVRGTAFHHAIKQGVIRKVGMVPSQSETTNAHEIKQYQSMHPRWREAS